MPSDFLDHAPAGFFSCRLNGDVSYMNATLAGWLGYDPAESRFRRSQTDRFRGRRRRPLTASAPGKAGKACTEQFDFDLKCRDGQSSPARLLHSVTFGQDGVPGAVAHARPQPHAWRGTRRGSGAPRSCASRGSSMRRRWRSPSSTRADGSRRSNAAFARLMPEALKPHGGAACSIFTGILDRDHAGARSRHCRGLPVGARYPTGRCWPRRRRRALGETVCLGGRRARRQWCDDLCARHD